MKRTINIIMQTISNRIGELGAVPIRTDRFFAVNAAWYFSTREGTSIGPFETKSDAKQGLNDFVNFIKVAEPRVLTSFLSTLKAD